MSGPLQHRLGQSGQESGSQEDGSEIYKLTHKAGMKQEDMTKMLALSLHMVNAIRELGVEAMEKTEGEWEYSLRGSKILSRIIYFLRKKFD